MNGILKVIASYSIDDIYVSMHAIDADRFSERELSVLCSKPTIQSEFSLVAEKAV